MAVFTTATGLWKFLGMNAPKLKYLAPISFVVVIGTVYCFEMNYKSMLKQEEEFASTKNGNLPKISTEEYAMRIENGHQLVILDDMVLDVSNFSMMHPGGSKLL